MQPIIIIQWSGGHTATLNVMGCLSVMFKNRSLNVSTPTKAKMRPKITPEINYWSFLHSKSHYVLSCSPFSKRRLEKDLFLSMNRSCMNINCLRYLPTCQKTSVRLWSQNCWGKTETTALVSHQLWSRKRK